MKTYFKEERFRSARYREFIRNQPALDNTILKNRASLHHVKATIFGGNSGWALTSSDDRGLPLTPLGHLETEAGEAKFYAKHNIDPRAEIIRLNRKFEKETGTIIPNKLKSATNKEK